VAEVVTVKATDGQVCDLSDADLPRTESEGYANGRYASRRGLPTRWGFTIRLDEKNSMTAIATGSGNPSAIAFLALGVRTIS